MRCKSISAWVCGGRKCWPMTTQGTERAFARPIDNIGYMRWHLRFPMAMHSRGRYVLVENLEISTSMSGLLRQFDGFELQINAAMIINQARAQATEVDFHPTVFKEAVACPLGDALA